MKIFVTVGNTHYNSLIKAIDEYLSPEEFDITIQLASGDYIPVNHPYIRYTNEISEYFNNADLIIAHAGAGTVFQLLEQHHKMVVVPNLERIDDHQLDLAQYLEKNNYACTCYDFVQLKQCIERAKGTEYNVYVNDSFDGYELIDEVFNIKPSNIVGGLPIHLFADMDEAVSHVITDEGQVISGSAIAINPEKVIKAIKEPSIKDALMSATIRYADGIGVVKTLVRKAKKSVSRIPGCELWEEIMKKSAHFQLPVFLVGATPETINATKDKLIKQYNVNICGIQDGYFDVSKEQHIINDIAKLQPKIVTVALGSPRQELFIQKCRLICPDTFFMGVGGTYDVYTNKVKRAPLFYRKLNLEWFYRLLHQPSRAFRQGNLFRYLFLEIARKL